MKPHHIALIALTVAALVSACGGGAADNAAQDPAAAQPTAAVAATPEGPVSIDYRIIGMPIVGQPLAIDIEIRSLGGPQAITVDYRINDSTALQLAESQPAQTTVAPTADTGPSVQQVRLVPLRAGRLFLNVAASVSTEDGKRSTVLAIPIQVDTAPQQSATEE